MPKLLDELLDVEYYRDLEMWVSGHSRSLKVVPFESWVRFPNFSYPNPNPRVRGSRSLKMAPFDRPYATFYSSAIVNIALSCTILEFFDVE